MTPLTILGLVLATVWLIGCIALAVAIIRAPLGWEDATGFHVLQLRRDHQERDSEAASEGAWSVHAHPDTHSRRWDNG